MLIENRSLSMTFENDGCLRGVCIDDVLRRLGLRAAMWTGEGGPAGMVGCGGTISDGWRGIRRGIRWGKYTEVESKEGRGCRAYELGGDWVIADYGIDLRRRLSRAPPKLRQRLINDTRETRDTRATPNGRAIKRYDYRIRDPQTIADADYAANERGRMKIYRASSKTPQRIMERINEMHEPNRSTSPCTKPATPHDNWLQSA